ncbi:MAG: hypothetical protein WC979_07735 [Candidatus Pacearchaeota archaeon]|jgi:hypothetical protein
MAKTRPISTLVSLVVWLTGVLVSLAVGFGMIDRVLTIQWISPVITMWAGWVVVILTLLSVILAIADKL